jgi:pimeloyl-ACP methyl ester carboxylesterase
MAIGRNGGGPHLRALHFAAAAVQNAALRGQRPSGPSRQWSWPQALTLATLVRLLDAPLSAAYRDVVNGTDDAATARRRVRGAGPALSYEVVGPTVAPAPQLTLLCLHGNSSHRGVWRLVAQELPEFRCVLLDLRGHGDSEHVSPPAYNPEDHADDLAQVTTHLAPGRYAILAHSAGALAAARFMTSAQPPTAMPVAFVWVDLDPLVPRWQVDYFHQGVASIARTFPAVDDGLRGFRRIYPNIPEDRLRSFVIEGLRQVDGGWHMKLDPGTYATWEPGDLRPCLPRVTCPTLVLRGADSIVTSTEGVAALSTGLPSCEVREIKGGSHMVLLEQPEEVARTIRQFLGAHAPTVQ